MRWAKQSRWVPAALAILDHFPDSNFTSNEAIAVVPGFKDVSRALREEGILIRKYRGNNNKKPSIYYLGQEAKEWLKTQR
jgi:hypothetical protein